MIEWPVTSPNDALGYQTGDSYEDDSGDSADQEKAADEDPSSSSSSESSLDEGAVTQRPKTADRLNTIHSPQALQDGQANLMLVVENDPEEVNEFTRASSPTVAQFIRVGRCITGNSHSDTSSPSDEGTDKASLARRDGTTVNPNVSNSSRSSSESSEEQGSNPTDATREVGAVHAIEEGGLEGLNNSDISNRLDGLDGTPPGTIAMDDSNYPGRASDPIAASVLQSGQAKVVQLPSQPGRGCVLMAYGSGPTDLGDGRTKSELPSMSAKVVTGDSLQGEVIRLEGPGCIRVFRGCSKLPPTGPSGEGKRVCCVVYPGRTSVAMLLIRDECAVQVLPGTRFLLSEEGAPGASTSYAQSFGQHIDCAYDVFNFRPQKVKATTPRSSSLSFCWPEVLRQPASARATTSKPTQNPWQLRFADTFCPVPIPPVAVTLLAADYDALRPQGKPHRCNKKQYAKGLLRTVLKLPPSISARPIPVSKTRNTHALDQLGVQEETEIVWVTGVLQHRALDSNCVQTVSSPYKEVAKHYQVPYLVEVSLSDWLVPFCGQLQEFLMITSTSEWGAVRKTLGDPEQFKCDTPEGCCEWLNSPEAPLHVDLLNIRHIFDSQRNLVASGLHRPSRVLICMIVEVVETSRSLQARVASTGGHLGLLGRHLRSVDEWNDTLVDAICNDLCALERNDLKQVALTWMEGEMPCDQEVHFDAFWSDTLPLSDDHPIVYHVYRFFGDWLRRNFGPYADASTSKSKKEYAEGLKTSAHRLKLRVAAMVKQNNAADMAPHKDDTSVPPAVTQALPGEDSLDTVARRFNWRKVAPPAPQPESTHPVQGNAVAPVQPSLQPATAADPLCAALTNAFPGKHWQRPPCRLLQRQNAQLKQQKQPNPAPIHQPNPAPNPAPHPTQNQQIVAHPTSQEVATQEPELAAIQEEIAQVRAKRATVMEEFDDKLYKLHKLFERETEKRRKQQKAQ